MTTQERLTQILVKNYKLDPTQLTPQRPLAELGLDSLAMVELLFLIEDEFSVKLPPDADLLPTLDVAVHRIDELIAAQHGQALPQQSA